jgi:uncharacterized lipoprotein YddW (UPF0748 family)
MLTGKPCWTTSPTLAIIFTKESLQEDLDNLYAMGVNLASAEQET